MPRRDADFTVYVTEVNKTPYWHASLSLSGVTLCRKLGSPITRRTAYDWATNWKCPTCANKVTLRLIARKRAAERKSDER